MAVAAPPPPLTPMPTLPSDVSTDSIPIGYPLFSRGCLAAPSGVPHIQKLIHQMTVFERLSHLFSATESALSANLFFAPPFRTFIIFILEVSLKTYPENSIHNSNPNYSPLVRVLNFDIPVEDPEWEIFELEDEDILIASFVMFFPNFSSFLGKLGFYVEDILVRECYRMRGGENIVFSDGEIGDGNGLREAVKMSNE